MGFFSSGLALLLFVTTGPFQKGIAIPPPCHKNWEFSNGFCYKLFNQKAQWQEAELLCHDYSRSGHLVSIHNKQESAIVVELIKAHEHDQIWIGLYADNMRGQWWWIDDSTYDFAVWAPGEPSYQGNVKIHCVQLSPVKGTAGQWKWEASNCEIAKVYICKYKP